MPKITCEICLYSIVIKKRNETFENQNSAIKKMFKYLQYQDQCQILHGLWNVFETTIKTGSKRTSVRSTENLKSRIALIGLINIYVESGW